MLVASRYLLGGIKWQMLEMEFVISGKSTHKGYYQLLVRQNVQAELLLKDKSTAAGASNELFPTKCDLVYQLLHCLVVHIYTTNLHADSWVDKTEKCVWNFWWCFDVKRLCSLHRVGVWAHMQMEAFNMQTLSLEGLGWARRCRAPRWGLGEARSWRALRGACGLCA